MRELNTTRMKDNIGLRHGSLFSGIGGFDLAAEWMNWENIFHCEWNPFCQKVLKYYWPNALSYENIKETDFTIHRNKIDILTGGFPCQPYSTAGDRRGKEDDRHLWPEFLRSIKQIRPRWIVGENVRGLISWSGGMVFDEIQFELEAEGYTVWPFLLSACSINAPNRRDRIWFVAHSNLPGWGHCDKEMEGGSSKQFDSLCLHETSTNSNCNFRPEGRLHKKGQEQTERYISSLYARSNEQEGWNKFPTQSPICSGNDGLQFNLDGITIPKWRNQSIKAYGNAIVPDVAHQIFKAIEQYEQLPDTLSN
jgi:DNA (cytosine-5)-methyltransferase 1